MEKNMDNKISNQITTYQQYTLKDIQSMAIAIVESNLFGIKTAKEAVGLMLVAQAEGRHPALVARDYHIIQGKATFKADAMLARFQEAGGKVEWLQLDDEKVEAKFIHPQSTAIINWDMARAKKAELLGRDMWRKYPRQMLRARVISEGVRTVLPSCICGIYETEEVKDMDIKDITNDSVVISSDVATQHHNGGTATGRYKRHIESQQKIVSVSKEQDIVQEESVKKDYTDYYNNMKECDDLKELSNIYKDAFLVMTKYKDDDAKKELVSIKDSMKEKIEATRLAKVKAMGMEGIDLSDTSKE
jgi:hypothetical protein